MDRSLEPNLNGCHSSSPKPSTTTTTTTAAAQESPVMDFIEKLSPFEKDKQLDSLETPLPFKEVVETTSPNYNQGHFTNPGMILDLGDSFEPDHNKETAQPNAFDQALLLPSINKPNLPVDQRENRNEYVVSGTLEHHHGTRKKLMFDSAKANISSGRSLNIRDVKPVTVVTNTESLLSPSVETKVSSNIQPAVNSVRFMSTSTNMYSSNQLGGYSSLQTRKRDLDMINDLSRNSNTSLFSPAAGEPYFPVNNNRQRDNYAPPQFTDSVNPYAAPMVHFEQQPVLCIRSMPPSLDTDRGENLNQVSPKAKRNKATITDTKINKGCNCKKSNCSKLYCECFGARKLCTASCGCEKCENNINFEDTLEDKIKEVEARNPLAFCPKVILDGVDSPANITEEGARSTPVSARHKKGCNCKKSKCVKRYCECYQANVGCSNLCRCEDCQNSFGRKADSVYRRIETQNNPSNLNVDSVMGRIQNTESETRNTNNQLSILESAVEMSSFTSSFHPYSVGELTSFPPEVRSHPTVGRSPLYPGNHPHMPSPANSPCSLTPQLISSNPSLGFYNPLQANSTNQNQVVSQPQFLSNWLSSSLAPTNSRTDRKVALKNMPPSVSRTP